MANTIAAPYVDALSAQKQKMEGYVASGVKAITFPAQHDEMESKDKLLAVSGYVFGAIAVILLVVGLILKEPGLVWAAAASAFSGAYCYFKAVQLGRRRAFMDVAEGVIGKLNDISSGVASGWSSFNRSQNNALTRDIIASAAANDAKAAMVDNIASAPLDIDIDTTAAALRKAAGEEKIDDISAAMQQYVTAASTAIDAAAKSQAAVYSAVDAANK